MAELNFVKGERYYEAVFKITGPTNVHLEREQPGALHFKQRGCDRGQFDYINSVNYVLSEDLVIDRDVTPDVYPKWIQVLSASPITMAVLTSDSDIEVL